MRRTDLTKSKTDICDAAYARRDCCLKVKIVERKHQNSCKRKCNICKNKVCYIDYDIGCNLAATKCERGNAIRVKLERHTSANELEAYENPDALDSACRRT